MFTIKNELSNMIIIKNSKFITCIYKVYNVDEVNKYLNSVKSIYKDATHYCYAYIIDDNKKFSDDNEPGGTAGSPIMQVLTKNNLNYVLCVVIRYFGGIKLGAGGIVRAYSKSVSECLKDSILLTLTKGKNITISFDYDKIKRIDNILKDEVIINKCFSDNVIYELNTSDEILDKLRSEVKVIVNKDVYIEK